MKPNFVPLQPDETFFPFISPHVNVRRDYELRYWSEKFGVTRDAVEATVKKVGTRAEDVARELRWQGPI
jgi:hypothetical protein